MLTKRRYWKDELWLRIFLGGGSENANSFINEHSSALAGAQVASQFCGSQTKILKEGTEAENRIVEVLLAGVSTRFGLRTIKKSIESQHFIFCSVFRNLRLGSINSLQTRRRFQHPVETIDDSDVSQTHRSPRRGGTTGGAQRPASSCCQRPPGCNWNYFLHADATGKMRMVLRERDGQEEQLTKYLDRSRAFEAFQILQSRCEGRNFDWARYAKPLPVDSADYVFTHCSQLKLDYRRDSLLRHPDKGGVRCGVSKTDGHVFKIAV